jgi:hypothetical protein
MLIGYLRNHFLIIRYCNLRFNIRCNKAIHFNYRLRHLTKAESATIVMFASQARVKIYWSRMREKTEEKIL